MGHSASDHPQSDNRLEGVRHERAELSESLCKCVGPERAFFIHRARISQLFNATLHRIETRILTCESPRRSVHALAGVVSQLQRTQDPSVSLRGVL